MRYKRKFIKFRPNGEGVRLLGDRAAFLLFLAFSLSFLAALVGDHLSGCVLCLPDLLDGSAIVVSADGFFLCVFRVFLFVRPRLLNAFRKSSLRSGALYTTVLLCNLFLLKPFLFTAVLYEISNTLLTDRWLTAFFFGRTPPVKLNNLLKISLVDIIFIPIYTQQNLLALHMSINKYFYNIRYF